MEPNRRPTLSDVAAASGVSRALASIVMRGAEGASDATREKVLAAARDLGYRPDSRARLLRSRRTRLLGVSFTLSEPFHAEIVESLYAAADAAGYEIALSAVAARRPESRAVESLLDAGVEALVMVAPESTPEQAKAYTRQVPVVTLLSPSDTEGVDAVRSDDSAGIRASLEHLVGLGHHNIAHIDGGEAIAAAERRAAYLHTMNELGLGAYTRVIRGGPHEEDGARAAAELLAANRPTAVVVFNDRCALGVLEAARQRDIKVPAELSVTAYDDSQLARLSHVQLTSVSPDAQQLAATAVACAAARLNGQEPVNLVHQPHLVTRATTAAPSAAG